MNIAIVTTYPPSAGTLNEYAYHFVRFLRCKPDVGRVDLLVEKLPPGQSYDLDMSGTPVQVFPCWQVGAWDNVWRILRTLRHAKPDIVFFNLQFATFGKGKVSGALGLCSPPLTHLAGFPTVVLLHNIVETVDLKSAGFGKSAFSRFVVRFFGHLITRLILQVDLVAFTIPKYVEIIREKYQAQNAILAPHGTFEEMPQPSGDLPEGPLQILTFGKFGTYKKVEVLIDAFQRLKVQSQAPLELVIAGTDSPNTPGYLAGVAQRYGEVAGLRFTGYVAEQDVPDLFRRAAVVVFPYSSTTGSSGVLHQAGSYGKAVVLPNLGDFAELIAEEGYVGEFFEPEDPQSLADTIAQLLNDPARRREQGLRNFRAASGLPISEIVEWYLVHFDALLKDKRHVE